MDPLLLCATRGRRSARRGHVAERCTASGVMRQRRFRWVAGAAGDTRFVWTSRRLLAGIAHSDRAQATAVRVQQAHLVVPRG